MRSILNAKNIKTAPVVLILACFFTGLLFFRAGNINSSEIVLAGEIPALIDDLTKSAESQDAAVTRLVAMGGPAVPHIVSHLGDMRPLAARQVKLRNNYPGARERFRTYEAELVHDALSDLLNEITGERFPTFQDGATVGQRLKNQNRWIEWCLARYPQSGKICSGTGSNLNRN